MALTITQAQRNKLSTLAASAMMSAGSSAIQIIRPDPVVVATEHELDQPTDEAWLYFGGQYLQRDQIVGVTDSATEPQHLVGPYSPIVAFDVHLRTGRCISFQNHTDYGGSGKSTKDWFVAHALKLTTKRREARGFE